jgi:Flp pilus assembly protein TadG
LARLLARGTKSAWRMRSEEGGSLVEFAILLPVFFVILAMAASLTLTFYNMQQLAGAASNAVEQVAAQQGVTPDPCNLAMTTVQATLPSFNTANISYSLTVTNSSGTGTTNSTSSTGTGNNSNTGFSCTTAAAESVFAAEEPVTLKLSYQYNWLPLPNFSILGAVPTSLTLTVPETVMSD